MNDCLLRFAALTLLLLLVSVPGLAGERIALGVRGSTLGLGAELHFKLNDDFTLRAMGHASDADVDDEYSDVDYDAELDLSSFGVVVDYRFAGSFRVSAGLFSNGNEITATGRPTGGEFEIGGTTYPAAAVGTLRGAIEFDDIAPFLGIGWGNAFEGGRFRFHAELGVYLQGSPDVRLSASNEDTIPGLSDDLERERRQFEDDLDGYDFWPVLSVGVSYRF